MFKKRKKANSKPIEGLTELLGCTPVDYGDSEKFCYDERRKQK